jgi:hypothetical protein
MHLTGVSYLAGKGHRNRHVTYIEGLVGLRRL